MTKKNVTWEEILLKFDEVEEIMFEEDNEDKINEFFKYLKENFTIENGFDKTQFLEARSRIAQILAKIGSTKDELLERKASLTTNEKKLNKYSKAADLDRS
jgi:uncharacterized protein YaaN involved in tellurite resistance